MYVTSSTNTTTGAPHFPDSFLWGVATASHQVEGGNANNDIWFLENLHDTFFHEPSLDAIDHYHRFAEDIDLIASLGLNTYRFSLEWSRIEPVEGHFSLAAIAHYRRMLESCKSHDLTTVVTLHHFTSPLWLLRQGGWESSNTPALFARYCTFVMEQLGDLIDWACTLNEPNLPWLLAEVGLVEKSPDQRKHNPAFVEAARQFDLLPTQIAPFQFTATREGFDIKVEAHRKARQAIKAVCPDTPVGWTLANSDIQAAEGGEERARHMRAEVNERFLEVSRDDDFVGIQTYGRHLMGAEGPAIVPEGASTTATGEEIYPEGLEATIRQAAEIARVPVLVTENGLATDDDAQRVDYIRRALRGVQRCLNDGIDVRGWICWSAFDNFEWIFGYGPRYGVISVDRSTFERSVNPSGYLIGQISQTNGGALAESA